MANVPLSINGIPVETAPASPTPINHSAPAPINDATPINHMTSFAEVTPPVINAPIGQLPTLVNAEFVASAGFVDHGHSAGLGPLPDNLSALTSSSAISLVHDGLVSADVSNSGVAQIAPASFTDPVLLNGLGEWNHNIVFAHVNGADDGSGDYRGSTHFTVAKLGLDASPEDWAGFDTAAAGHGSSYPFDWYGEAPAGDWLLV